MGRRHISDVVRHAVEEELRAGTPAKELASRYEISEATISRWKKKAGISNVPFLNGIVRSKPLRSDKPADLGPEDSKEDSPAGRRALIKKQLSLIDDLLEQGHLKSSDIRNLAQASKVLNEADARFEREEQEEQARASARSQGEVGLGPNSSRETRLVELVSTNKLGIPLYAEAYFAVGNYGDALDRNEPQEDVDQAWARLVETVRSYGITRVTEDDYQRMDDRMQRDFHQQLLKSGESEEQIEKKRREAWATTPQYEPEFDGQGLA